MAATRAGAGTTTQPFTRCSSENSVELHFESWSWDWARTIRASLRAWGRTESPELLCGAGANCFHEGSFTARTSIVTFSSGKIVLKPSTAVNTIAKGVAIYCWIL